MPWPQNHLPKYRKHRASGQAIVTLNGRDYYLGPHGTDASKLEYDRLIAEWLQNGRSPLDIQAEDLTLVEVSSRYLKFASQYYQKDGKQTREVANIRIALREVCQLYGRQTALAFGPRALRAHRQRLIANGLSRGYINKQVAHIKRMYRWAASYELLPVTAANALGTVAGLAKGRSEAREAKPIAPVSDEVVEITLPLLPKTVAVMVRFQRLTGCRPAEVCSLRPCDLDRSEEVWIYRPETHKTEHHGKDRTIFVGPRAQQLLAELLNRESGEYCFRPCDSEADRNSRRHAARKTPLSCGNKPKPFANKTRKRPPGQKYTTDSYRRAIHVACRKAGVQQWSPNRLRHAAATEIRRQFGLEAAQIILGHAQADITQLYAERDLARGASIALAVG